MEMLTEVLNLGYNLFGPLLVILLDEVPLILIIKLKLVLILTFKWLIKQRIMRHCASLPISRVQPGEDRR